MFKVTLALQIYQALLNHAMIKVILTNLLSMSNIKANKE